MTERRDPADELTFASAFELEAARRAELMAARKPHIRRFPLAQFDGCTLGPDAALDCCFLHDLADRYAETPEERRAADRNLLLCIRQHARYETAVGKPLWWLTGAVYWIAVHTFGGGILRRRHKAWARAR